MLDDLGEGCVAGGPLPFGQRLQVSAVVFGHEVEVVQIQELEVAAADQDRHDDAQPLLSAAARDRQLGFLDVFRGDEVRCHQGEKNISLFEVFPDFRIPVGAAETLAVVVELNSGMTP